MSEDLITVIPNFYDPRFAATDSPAPSDDDRSTVLYVGRLEGKKGVDLLIEAAAAVSADVSVHIIGDGPDRSQLERQATSLGVDEQVTFHGWVKYDDLPDFYRLSDIFVHPGRWPEPFGRTVLEAIQHGCVPIVSNVGAPPWIVDDSELTFERDDSADLAATIQSVSDDGKAGRGSERRLQRFDPERVVSQIEAEYRAIRRTI